MIVPARALRIGEEGATFSALPSDQLSALLQAQLRTAPLAGCSRLLHIRFNLNDTSNVVMPKHEFHGIVRGTPLKLLSSLKSLSESQSFDAFINFNSYAQCDIQHICQRLCNSGLSTPLIDVDAMYGRGGGFNLWEQQGLPKTSVGVRESTPPPPYDQSTSPEHRHLPTKQIGTDVNEHDDYAREPTASQLPPSAQPCSASVPASAQPCLDRVRLSSVQPCSIGASRESPPCLSTQHVLQHSSKPLSEHTPVAEITTPNMPQPSTPIRPEPVNAPRPGQSPEIDVVPRALVPQSVTPEPLPAPPSEASYIVETVPSPVDASFLDASFLEATDIDDPPLDIACAITARKRKTISPMSSPRASQSHTLHEKRACQREKSSQVLAPNDLLSEGIHWLFVAWETCPDTHFLLRDELVALGTAAGRGDTPSFDAARARCSTRLAFNAADYTSPQRDSIIIKFSAEVAVLEVVKWINTVDREADIVIREHLVLLAQTARTLERSCGAEQGYGDAKRSYELQKAACILRACFFSGRRAVMRL